MWINPNCLHLEESPAVAVNQTITCDRCREEIIRDRTILKIESGPRRHEPGIDLCTRCLVMLMAYVGRETATPSKPVEETVSV